MYVFLHLLLLIWHTTIAVDILLFCYKKIQYKTCCIRFQIHVYLLRSVTSIFVWLFLDSTLYWDFEKSMLEQHVHHIILFFIFLSFSKSLPRCTWNMLRSRHSERYLCLCSWWLCFLLLSIVWCWNITTSLDNLYQGMHLASCLG